VKEVVQNLLLVILSLNFFFRTANVTGSIILQEGSVVMPGDSLDLIIELLEYCPLIKDYDLFLEKVIELLVQVLLLNYMINKLWK